MRVFLSATFLATSLLVIAVAAQEAPPAPPAVAAPATPAAPPAAPEPAARPVVVPADAPPPPAPPAVVADELDLSMEDLNLGMDQMRWALWEAKAGMRALDFKMFDLKESAREDMENAWELAYQTPAAAPAPPTPPMPPKVYRVVRPGFPKDRVEFNYQQGSEALDRRHW